MMMKKILLFLLLLSAFPFAELKALSYTDANGVTWYYSVVNGSNAKITGASGYNGALNIPAKVGNSPQYNVTEIGSSAFYNTSITSLTIPESVTTIGINAFYYCKSLTGKVVLPNVTTIETNAFSSCPKLEEVEIPEVTTIGGYAFFECHALKNVSFPKVTTIGDQAFVNCKELSGKLVLPNVKTIGNSAFGYCSKLTGLELPKIEIIDSRAFVVCQGLTGKIELPKTLKTLGGEAFQICDNISAITFENGTVLESINGLGFNSNRGSAHFERCYNLQYIDMSGVTLPSTLTTIGRENYTTMFYRVMPYTMVYLPSSAPAIVSGEENFVVGETCDKFVVYDDYGTRYKNGVGGCDYPILYPFKATIAQYIRALSGETFKSVCLPYKATLPKGLRAYKLVKKTGGGARFRFESAGDGDETFQLDAYTPYLIRIIDGENYTENSWESHNMQVAVTPAKMEVALDDGQTFFGGTTTNIDNATAASNNYYNLSNNTWMPISTTDANGFVRSMRAYIRTTGGAPAKGFAIVLDNDDNNTTTDIDNAAELTEDELRNGKHTFYTLDGRRAGTDYDTLKGGEMYIVKGKKFYKF